MTTGTPAEWSDWCRARGIDPAEVRLVFGRYRAYRGYYERGRGEPPLPLENWFTFYRMEAASEAEQATPAASGCSVDPGARNRGAVTRPAEFLDALARLAALE